MSILIKTCSNPLPDVEFWKFRTAISKLNDMSCSEISKLYAYIKGTHGSNGLFPIHRKCGNQGGNVLPYSRHYKPLSTIDCSPQISS